MSAVADRLIQSPELRAQHQEMAQTAVSIGRLQTRIVTGAEWDRTIADFDEVCQEQLYAFAVARWPSVRQEPMLFLLDGEVVGGSLIMIQPLPLGVGRIAVSKWGPMLATRPRRDAAAIYAGMIEALIAEYAQRARRHAFGAAARLARLDQCRL